MNGGLNIPEFSLSENERLWLNEIYELHKKLKKPDYKELRIKLLKVLPINFNPQNIDRHLVDYNGERLTIIGLHVIDPKSDILEKANKVIRFLRRNIMSDPSLLEFEVSDIKESVDLENYEIQIVLESINKFGTFWTSASGSGKNEGYTSISFQNDRDNTIFHQYLFFESIEKLINSYFEEEKNQRSKNIKNQPRKVKGFLQKGVGIGRKSNLYFDNYLETEEGESTFNFKPIFQSKIEHIDPSLCFVLMPFTQEWSTRVFAKLIKPVVENLGLQCLRADNLTGPIVVEDIWTKINQSAFIIADVTGRNPNVMYELGIVHTIGKPAILITQEIDQIPFDFVHLRHHPYEDNIEGFELFNGKLGEMIQSLYKDNFPEFDLGELK